MTIEAKLDAVIEQLKILNGKFEHIGGALPAGHNDDAERAAHQAGRKVTSVPPAAPKPEKQPAAQKPAAKAEGVSYDVLKAAIQSRAKTHRPALLKILEGYQVKSAQELRPEQYAEVLAKVEAIK
jgi:hypothetical protein